MIKVLHRTLVVLLCLYTVPLLAARQRAIASPSGECTMNVSPRTVSVPAAGGSSILAVTSSGRCQWQARANAPWIVLTAATTGSVAFGVTANAETTERIGTIDIGGVIVTVAQAPATALVQPNLLSNADFNRDLSDWLAIYSTGTGSAVWSSLDGNSVSGSGSALLTSTQGGFGYQLHQCVSITGGKVHEIGARVNIPVGQDPNGVIILGFYPIELPNCDLSQGVLSRHEPARRLTTGTWVDVTDTVTTPPTARSALFVFALGGHRTPPFRAYFDKVFVRERNN